MKSIDHGIKSEKVTAKVTAKVTVNQRKILDALNKNPHATQAELANLVGITRKSIISNMKKLRELGLIRRSGSDKNGVWLTEASWQS